MPEWDVIVVGVGHAGAEAALAAARLGSRVVAITQNPERACWLSCNPAIGGPGKSQLVREIDVLGGAMAHAADASAIQVRRLNRSRGPATWATRHQVDRRLYPAEMQSHLRRAGIPILQADASELEMARGRTSAVRLSTGERIEGAQVVLTTGTFLAARMHVGVESTAGGRVGEGPSDGLANSLRAAGVRMGRFKTGTPPRLDGRTIDWRSCEEQPTEPDVGPFSRRTLRFPRLPQRSAFVTATNAATAEVVRRGLPLSPLTSRVRASGPRYCPSLEQKVLHYPDRERHVVYLEPDALDSLEVYPAGLSTSLPAQIQLELLRTIPGLEHVELVRPGYAVEYDYLVEGQLQATMESRVVAGLFTAGQINGSSGYEEAAAQGLVAGVNAARFAQGKAPWIPAPEDSYLGVLCADLCRGVDEPYRILPGRAEHRLRLREDNVGLRLWRTGHSLGLIDAEAETSFRREAERFDRALAQLTADEKRAIRQPSHSEDAVAGPLSLDSDIAIQVVRAVRYQPYEEQRSIARARLMELYDAAIPPDLDPHRVLGLSPEAVAALAKGHPTTLAEAARLPGFEDAAVAILAAHLRRRSKVPRGTTAPDA